jgi:hypothetical protein
MTDTWYPITDDDAFLERDGHAEAVAARGLLRSLTEDGGMGSTAGTITMTGFDDNHEMLVTMSAVRRADEILLVVSRRDGTISWFTSKPPDD